MMRYRIHLIALPALLCSACVPGLVIKSDPPVARVQTEEYAIAVMPGPCTRDQFKVSDYTGCHYFAIAVLNKTDSNIEIDWNRTMYVTNGQTSGTFMFGGVSYLNRDAPKAPDIVFPNQTFRKEIYPTSLVIWSTAEKGWYNQDMSAGSHGVYFSMKVDGVERREHLKTRISIHKAH